MCVGKIVSAITEARSKESEREGRLISLAGSGLSAVYKVFAVSSARECCQQFQSN